MEEEAEGGGGENVSTVHCTVYLCMYITHAHDCTINAVMNSQHILFSVYVALLCSSVLSCQCATRTTFHVHVHVRSSVVSC